jgi:BolA protein
MRVALSIETKLREALAPSHLRVTDDSRRHAGHAGIREQGGKADGETHFSVEIVSARFAGMRPVERQRLVYALLKDEIAGGVHALSLVTKTPQESGVDSASP